MKIEYYYTHGVGTIEYNNNIKLHYARSLWTADYWDEIALVLSLPIQILDGSRYSTWCTYVSHFCMKIGSGWLKRFTWPWWKVNGYTFSHFFVGNIRHSLFVWVIFNSWFVTLFELYLYSWCLFYVLNEG